MKTLEFKLSPNSKALALFEQWTDELSWIWNEGLKLLLEFHQHRYYEFMLKEAAKRGICMDGIDMVRLNFPRHSAWSLPTMPSPDRVKRWLTWKPNQLHKFVGIGGATCTIARVVDGRYEQIAKGERFMVSEARLKTDNDKSLSGYLTKKRLNQLRVDQGLDLLTVHSDYIGGVFKQLAASWKAYCDPKIRHAYKPKFRGGKNPGVTSLFGLQPEGLRIEQGQIKFPGLGLIDVTGTRLPKRLKLGSLIRSAILKREPSGYYACLAIALPLEVEKQQIKRELDKVRRTAKQQGSKLDSNIESTFKQQLQQIETAIAIHARAKAKVKPSNKIVGIDPGVASLLTTDDGRSYSPNKELARKERKLKRLQRKAARQYQQNKDNSEWQRKNHDKTQCEVALQWEKIRRSRSAYTHKLSTKLVREFGVIAIEDTQITNMVKASKPKVNETGTGYDRNNRKAKAGLNRAILNSCIGQLRQRIESKSKAFDRRYLKNVARGSSQHCHACGELGERLTQSDFYCRNPHCTVFDVRQHADINAARNHLIGAISEFTGCESYPGLAGERVSNGKPKPEDPVISPERGTTCSNAGETLSISGTPQEAGNVSDSEPSPEYGEQSSPKRESTFKVQLRESLDVLHSDLLDTPNPIPHKEPRRRGRRKTRAPDMMQLSFNLGDEGERETG